MWPFMQDPRLIERFYGHGQIVMVEESGKAQVSVSPISAEEITGALDEIE